MDQNYKNHLVDADACYRYREHRFISMLRKTIVKLITEGELVVTLKQTVH